MSKNVASQLLEIIAETGVKQIFGVTGDALNYFVSAIESHRQVNWIGMKHEGNSSFAAFAQGELGAPLGVCAGTTGPGALHLINGLYNAKKERSPLIVITGQIPLKEMGSTYFQEVDLKKIFDDICDFQAIIRSPEQAPRIIQKAIKIAISKRTVCRVELPSDIAEMKAVAEEYRYPIIKSKSRLVPEEIRVEEAALALSGKKKIAILAGDGCRESKQPILELSKTLKAPIIHSLKASDIFSHDDENVVGLTGLIGNTSGYKAIKNCEVLLMLATDFPYSEFLPHSTKTIQVDIREENIGNRTSVDIGIHSDIASFLNLLKSKITENEDDSYLKKYRKQFSDWRAKINQKGSTERDTQPLSPQLFTHAINNLASKDAIFTIETGTSAIWAAHHISFNQNRRLIGSFNHGSMAVGLPAAIGAQFWNREREVWSISGDGAFNMCMQDFITAAVHNLPIKILILNNGEFSFVKLEMEEAGMTPSLGALQGKNINFAEYAKLCGGDGVRVEKAEDIEPAIQKAKESKKPFIIDAIVNSGELAIPPNVGVSEAISFGKSKIKEVVQAVKGDSAQQQNLKDEYKSVFS